MNKTFKKVLQVISYIISFLFGRQHDKLKS